MRFHLLGAVLAFGIAGGAQAAMVIPDGTAAISILSVPTVTLGATTGTASVPAGPAFAGNNSYISGTTGGFTSGGFGNFLGSITFSKLVGTTVTPAMPVADFFSFDGYSFAATSATTTAYTNQPASGAIAVYLLGSLSKTGFADTASSLTLSFNRTGSSLYSGSASLSIPPAALGAVPEPASWALMLVGFGAMGASLRRRKTSVTFA